MQECQTHVPFYPGSKGMGQGIFVDVNQLAMQEAERLSRQVTQEAAVCPTCLLTDI